MERACTLAWAAFDVFRETGLERRAHLLEAIAEQILALGDALIERTCAETGLPRGRIEGERGRIVGQLRLFAGIVRDGDWIEPCIDRALPNRTPLPRSDLRQRHVALGPAAAIGGSSEAGVLLRQASGNILVFKPHACARDEADADVAVKLRERALG